MGRPKKDTGDKPKSEPKPSKRKSSESKSSEANKKPKTSTPAPKCDTYKPKPLHRSVSGWSKREVVGPSDLHDRLDVNDPSTANEENDPSGAVRSGWYAERYEPEFITGRSSDCEVCGGEEDYIDINEDFPTHSAPAQPGPVLKLGDGDSQQSPSPVAMLLSLIGTMI